MMLRVRRLLPQAALRKGIWQYRHRHLLAEAESEPSLPTASQAALLPARLLQPGELVLLMTKPSLWYILLMPLGTLVGIALVTGSVYALAVAGAVPFVPRDVVLLGSGAVLVRVFWQFLEWLSRVYVLTDRRIIRVMGVTRVDVFEVSLGQIHDVRCTGRTRERLLGLGTLVFTMQPAAPPEANWVMLARPVEVQQLILRTLGRWRKSS